MMRIALTKGYEAMIDDEDYCLVSDHKWSADVCRSKVYAVAGKPKVSMHRFLLRATKGQVVDHIDGNGLNNQRSNLRIASLTANNRNKRAASRYGFKGIRFSAHAPSKPWWAAIKVNDKTIQKGGFATREEAAMAYDELAREHFGSDAWLNFPGAALSRARALAAQS